MLIRFLVGLEDVVGTGTVFVVSMGVDVVVCSRCDIVVCAGIVVVSVGHGVVICAELDVVDAGVVTVKSEVSRPVNEFLVNLSSPLRKSFQFTILI